MVVVIFMKIIMFEVMLVEVVDLGVLGFGVLVIGFLEVVGVLIGLDFGIGRVKLYWKIRYW